jgi:hypothetical protein
LLVGTICFGRKEGGYLPIQSSSSSFSSFFFGNHPNKDKENEEEEIIFHITIMNECMHK